MAEATGYLSCRIEPELEKKFRDKAAAHERKPSQMLRLLVKQFVEAKSAARKPQLATAR